MRTIATVLLASLLAMPASLQAATRTAVQPVPCIANTDLRMFNDGMIYTCRLDRSANLRFSPEKAGTVACASSAYVEFFFSGFVAYCDKLTTTRSFRQRGGGEETCQRSVAFDDDGYLAYCD